MRKRLLLTALLIATGCQLIIAQSLSINTDGSTANASAMLDIKSTIKGMLIPRMDKSNKNAISSPAAGLLVYQISPDSIGFHYYDGSSWIWLLGSSALNSQAWKINGNSATNPSTNFLGTTDNKSLVLKVNNISAGILSATSDLNTSFGYYANPSFAGNYNTTIGYASTYSNTTGSYNTAIGHHSLYTNNSGSNNTAAGFFALRSNLSGNYNTAFGDSALYNNTVGNYNSALGYFANALSGLTNSTAIGANAIVTQNNSLVLGSISGTNGATSSVNVGIGTTAPSDKLEVNGNLRFSGVDTIYAAPSATGSGKSMWIRAGSPFVPVGGSGGSINIEATNNMPAGGSGYANLGPSGNINLIAGSGYNTAGGNINITAGQSSYWGLTNDTHSDVILKGGFDNAAADAATLTTEGGHIISLNSSVSNGGNLILKPGTGAAGGNNGTIKLDGVITIGNIINIAGGTLVSPVSLLNRPSYIGILPADAINNYYQLPDPTIYPGRTYIIRNNSSSNSAVISTAGGALLFPGNSNTGVTTYNLNPTSSPKTIMAISDGANWTIMVQN